MCMHTALGHTVDAHIQWSKKSKFPSRNRSRTFWDQLKTPVGINWSKKVLDFHLFRGNSGPVLGRKLTFFTTVHPIFHKKLVSILGMKRFYLVLVLGCCVGWYYGAQVFECLAFISSISAVILWAVWVSITSCCDQFNGINLTRFIKLAALVCTVLLGM